MTGTVVSFCLMAVAARELAGTISVFEILFFRSVIGLSVVSTIILLIKQKSLFRTHRLRIHLLRNVFHFGGQFGWVLGIGLLPLAEVFALEFTVPVWVTIIAALFLSERVTLYKFIAVILGLVGVGVIVQPGIAILDSASFIVLGAAVCYAIAHSTNKSLTNTEAPTTILFYMCLLQLPIGFAFSSVNWVWPSLEQLPWLVTIGMTALTGHYCLSRAMQLSDVGIVMTLEFFRLPVIALIGVALYGEAFDLAILLGGLIIFAGNLFNIKGQYSAKSVSQS
jgi:drug/metabolite transporter (DMT)-like permease